MLCLRVATWSMSKLLILEGRLLGFFVKGLDLAWLWGAKNIIFINVKTADSERRVLQNSFNWRHLKCLLYTAGLIDSRLQLLFIQRFAGYMAFQQCLKKSKHLTLDTAIDIGQKFEAAKDNMQVMADEDPRVEVNKVTTKPVQPKRHTNQRKQKKPQETCDHQDKCRRCGYRAHKQQEKCPAKNESCYNCNKYWYIIRTLCPNVQKSK